MIFSIYVFLSLFKKKCEKKLKNATLIWIGIIWMFKNKIINYKKLINND